jgi:phosphoribosylaminoimidazolecarboxamide formyltransferase/IMP cyclohydrolase
METHGGEVPVATRRELAAKAFAHTAAYDTAIATWLQKASAAGSPELSQGPRPAAAAREK